MLIKTRINSIINTKKNFIDYTSNTYIPNAEFYEDIILNLMILDNVYKSLFMITNDLVDLKNTKSLINIFKETGKSNYLLCLNCSRDTGRDYFSIFDIRNIINS